MNATVVRSSALTTLLATALLLLPTGTARAGRGSSAGAIASAIASGSVDAISSELERAEHLVCPACVPLVRPLVDHPDLRVRQVAAWWLGRRGLQGALQTEMIARLGGDDPVRARNGADVLGGLRRRAAITPLGAVLARADRDPALRAAAARALGRIGDPDAAPVLLAGLGAAEPEIRAATLESLRALRGPAQPALALAALEDEDEGVRVQAIYTIGAARREALATGPAGVTALAALLAADPSPRVRKKAAWALGEIGAPAGLAGPAVAHAAQADPDPLVRSLAAAAARRLTR